MKHISSETSKFNITFIIFSVFLIALIMFFFKSDEAVNKSNIEFISSYGWMVEDVPSDITHITVPEEFDSIFEAYAEAISADGFNLYAYRGKKVTRYSYTVTNHKASSDGLIRINLMVFDKEIIAADISSLSSDGFIYPISYTSDII